MIADVAQRLWKAPDIELRTAVPPLAVLAGALTLYVALRYILIAIAFGSPTGCLVLDVLAFAAAGSLSGVRYGEIPALLHPLLRGIGAVVLVQVAFDGAALGCLKAVLRPGASIIATPAPSWKRPGPS